MAIEDSYSHPHKDVSNASAQRSWRIKPKALKLKKALLLFVCIAITLVLTYKGGMKQYIARVNAEKALDASLYPNWIGKKIESTPQEDWFSEKPFSTLKITFPSLSSVSDDSENSKKATQVTDKEALDQGIVDYLKTSYYPPAAEKITDSIEIWYRDICVIGQRSDCQMRQGF
jgi:hypothetical protein